MKKGNRKVALFCCYKSHERKENKDINPTFANK